MSRLGNAVGSTVYFAFEAISIIVDKTMRFPLVLIFTVFLLACSSSQDEDLSRYIHRIETRPPKPIEPLPNIVRMEKFTFAENDTRRNPFKPVVETQGGDQFAPNIKRPKQPLEAFPLDALKFVGTFSEDGKNWALMSQPNGLISRVTLGNYLGQNYGQIVSIKEKTMDIEETVQAEGKWVKKKTTINLRTPTK